MFVPPSSTPPDLSEHPEIAEAVAFATKNCSLDIVDLYFKEPAVKDAILRFVTEVQLAHPKTPGTGLMAYMAIGLLHKYGLAVPQGGGSAFTAAVIRSIEAHGGEVRPNTEVIKIITEHGRAVGVRTRAGEIRAREAVIAQIHFHILDRLIDGLDPEVISAAKKTKLSEYTLFVVHAAMEKPLKFRAGGIANEVVVNTICPGSVESVIQSYGGNKVVGASIITNADPTRAPPGKSLLHAIVMLRADNCEVGFYGWDKIKDKVTYNIFQYLSKYVEDLSPDQIRGYHAVTPFDHESDTPCFQHGDICGLSMAADQMGAARPAPALAQYRVPGIKGLYLAGPFMHPGGGVWGGGRPVAIRVLEDMGIEPIYVNKTRPCKKPASPFAKWPPFDNARHLVIYFRMEDVCTYLGSVTKCGDVILTQAARAWVLLVPSEKLNASGFCWKSLWLERVAQHDIVRQRQGFATVLGYDFAGRVLKDSPGSKFEEGNAVAGYMPISIAQSRKYGTYQSFLAAPCDIVFKLPSNLPEPYAAALTLVVMTAADIVHNLFKCPLPTSPGAFSGPSLI
ncbi:FAD dependent oxidoreductase [Fusarium subglutinans]|uniref:FAD dependent oxidoreductase n=1 Tax=Gibberella subglutinans TaxID=42677 RepID=A0A8H5NVK4_GIBSU|nr:FAD dependent oxidoreductase [Fusarium subglutinans]KAF5579879.1 FAD dependent oxidoreductase [Fusarium subglutinans]